MTGRYLDEFEQPRVIVVTCLVGLVASYAVAIRRPLPSWELRVTDAINDVPGAVGSGLYPVMQLGTLGGTVVVAVAMCIGKRDLVLSAAVLITGVVTWFAAKGVKRLVARDRPLSYLPQIIVREGDGSGLGYISGHSAVAASASIMAMVALPERWRPSVAVVAGLVGVARIVHGVHLPADVVGGWSFGVLIGFAGLFLADAVRDRTSSGGHSSAEIVAP